MELTSCYGYRA